MDQGKAIVYYFYFMVYITETLNLKLLHFDLNMLVHGIYPKKITREGAKDACTGIFFMFLLIMAKQMKNFK